MATFHSSSEGKYKKTGCEYNRFFIKKEAYFLATGAGGVSRVNPPIYGWRAVGIVTLPSACWKFSSNGDKRSADGQS